MYTISDILADIDRGIAANNMAEDKFSYRIIYFVNDGNKGMKFRIDTPYDGLRESLENIIRKNLSLSNSIVVAETTVRKRGESVSLLSRAYPFSLDGYFRMINGEYKTDRENSTLAYGKCAVRQPVILQH